MRTSAWLRRRTTIRIDCGYGRMQHEATGDFMVCDQAVRSVSTGFQRDVYLPATDASKVDFHNRARVTY